MIKRNGKQLSLAINGKNIVEVRLNGKTYYKEHKGIPINGAPNGIYVLRTDNLLYSIDNWNTSWNDEAVGAAVISNSHPDGGFIIAKDESNETKTWGKYNRAVSGIMTTESSDIAKTDYDGENNTTKIISQDGSLAEASNYCRDYTFLNGKKGYLGALGEWWIAYQNKDAIDSCLNKIGGTSIKTSGYHWASTQHSSNTSYVLHWVNGEVVPLNKNFKRYVRAFAQLN